jgi:hypothetical protein
MTIAAPAPREIERQTVSTTAAHNMATEIVAGPLRSHDSTRTHSREPGMAFVIP